VTILIQIRIRNTAFVVSQGGASDYFSEYQNCLDLDLLFPPDSDPDSDSYVNNVWHLILYFSSTKSNDFQRCRIYWRIFVCNVCFATLSVYGLKKMSVTCVSDPDLH